MYWQQTHLMNMIDPDKGRAWNLSDDDRAAIQWAFDRIRTLEADLEREREERYKGYDKSKRLRESLESASRSVELAIQASRGEI